MNEMKKKLSLMDMDVKFFPALSLRDMKTNLSGFLTSYFIKICTLEGIHIHRKHSLYVVHLLNNKV